MTKRMLIDASHPEETRVVVVNDHQLEDFDFESSTKKQLKGNIYLAKVTRVEPSLQAAFVDYGGNRHGFLAFSEIHPDYYQIPQADRRLLEEANKAAAESAEGNGAGDEQETDGETEAVATDPEEEAAEVYDEQARRRSQLLRRYRIQEVIKRRQILLVQVVKEERGSKGAALTTYLSLAGRYCVLMPNTARGGGISRKISNPADRSRLKAIAKDLVVPEGMGLIIRTAGQERNKQEIRRDYEYLLRLWSDIRELTLKSIAPCTIHEEGALVQRAIRDLYTRDIDEVLVDGEDGYRTARKIMNMLMPSRARRVKLYKDEVPLFYRYQVEDRLDAMHSPIIQLKSGGSVVIHTTEALTAIDVNSGKSTRERNIEETALKTNLEATDEIARQLRLRDVAGLVVVDFIDMAEMRNQRAVERRLREALKSDRARVQLGRISPFGLLELSRQRLRPSFQELSTQPCPVCHGLGAVRSTESAALQALRAIELEGIRGTAGAIAITLPLATALYILNQKRDRLFALEQRYDMPIEIRVDQQMIAGDFEIEHKETRAQPEAEERAAAVAAAADGQAEPAAASTGDEDADGAGRRRRRRRRRRRKPADGEAPEAEAVVAAPQANGEAAPAGRPDHEQVADQPPADQTTGQAEAAAVSGEGESEAKSDEEPKRRRRRSRPARSRTEPAVAELKPAEAETTPADAGGKRVGRRRRKRDAEEPGAESMGSAPTASEQQEMKAGAAQEHEAVAPEDQAAGPGKPAEEASEEAAEATESQEQPAEGETGEGEREEHKQPDVPPAAMVNRGGGSPPRRGWWSRFVRKDE